MDKQCIISFQQSQKIMTKSPALGFPNFSKPFMVETYAFWIAIMTILLQGQYLLTFFNRNLSPLMQKASTYVMGLYTIIEPLNKIEAKFVRKSLHIRIDQKNIRELMQQVIQIHEQKRFLVNLLGYDYTIEYKLRASNKVVDALSRKIFETL